MTIISLCCTLPRVESDIFQPIPDSPKEQPIPDSPKEQPKQKTKDDEDDNVTYPLPPKNNNWIKAERSWSGNLASQTSHLVKTQMDPFAGKPKFNHRRFYSLSEVDEFCEEPKLVRSCGVRRNWSFEDIENNNE